jgi:Rps23 Pro-64 3,4-dihydroxylase Tpa1-like proline 4-hydroxylase
MINDPFPHVIIDDFIPVVEIDNILAEWPKKMGSISKDTSIKRFSTRLPTAAKRLVRWLNSKEFIARLESITGIPNLIPDKKLRGGGLHEIRRGGFLGMHVDFNQLPGPLYRRVNLLIYLNKNWLPEFGGQLLLGEKMEVMVEPIAGRAVIFNTSETSWHGHPFPLSCPENMCRRSIALYYYTKEKPDWFTDKHSTVYK